MPFEWLAILALLILMILFFRSQKRKTQKMLDEGRKEREAYESWLQALKRRLGIE